MSELKWNWVYYPYLDAPNEQEESALKAGYIKVVDKSEADKVIARHKYKRCLAMAKWCESKVYHIRRTPLCDMDEHEYWQYENDFWQRWQKRWLELAEKFKEAK